MTRNLRVYELGRHYGVDSKQIMTLLKKMKVVVKSHMSVVEDTDVDRVHSVFQRKRELARENYARAHGLNPSQLKNVAALKPLDRPQPVEEPEPKKKKATKKKVTKKKKKAAAKPKVLVIKKSGTMTAVARKSLAAREAKEDAKAADEARLKEENEAREAKLATKREEHAKARIVKNTAAKLVKKADIKPKEEEAPVAEAEVETPVVEAPVVADEATPEAEVETNTETETTEAVVAAEEPAAAVDDPAATETPGAEPEVPAAEAEVAAPAKEKKAEPVDRLANVGSKKNDGFKVGDIIRPAPKVGTRPKTYGVDKPSTSVSSASVRDSIKAAIQRRKDEAESRETPSRRKRTRKKKKVDQAEVDKALKQTMAQMGGAGSKKKRRKEGGAEEEVVEVVTEVLKLTEFITVQELAEKLGVKAQELIGKLFALGIMTTINQRLEKDNIEMLAAEYDRELEFLTELGEEVLEAEEIPDADLTARPPVVTVMGHVDHGKTSLLDSIRKTNVIAGEAGHITQHIGAYKVQTDGGPITFLDTPGHAAFTAMRARGAQVTDIVILIVAADDSVMPQTVEAISHAKAAGVPLIVAVNKIDLPAAKPEKVKQELLQHNIVIEEFGGDVLCAEISAKQGLGIDKLLEMIHLQSDVLELKASTEGKARGTVVEARKEQGRGVVFTVLVNKGTLRKGDNFLVGMTEGKVRAIANEDGQKVAEVLPGQPCEIMGGNDVPEAGDRFYVVKDEREARELAGNRRRLQRQQQIVKPKQVIDLDNLAELMTAGDLKELPIIIKGDVAGSVEALADQFMELNTAEVQVKVVHKAVGALTESDVLLAANTGAMIIGFHIRPGSATRELAKRHHVTIEVFDIIYEAVDTLRKAMAGLLGSIQREVSTGSAQVRQVFTIPKVGQVAGSMVINGVIKRNSKARLVRDEVVVFEGKVNSLKRFKDDVKEVQTGYECGIGLENFYDIQESDVLECYEIEEIKRTEL